MHCIYLKKCADNINVYVISNFTMGIRKYLSTSLTFRDEVWNPRKCFTRSCTSTSLTWHNRCSDDHQRPMIVDCSRDCWVLNNRFKYPAFTFYFLPSGKEKLWNSTIPPFFSAREIQRFTFMIQEIDSISQREKKLLVEKQRGERTYRSLPPFARYQTTNGI